MKLVFRFALLLIYFLSSFHAYSENTELQLRAASFIKVWGFLKYHHHGTDNDPEYWDKVFTSGIDSVLNSKDKNGFNDQISLLIAAAGDFKSKKKSFKYPDSDIKNFEFNFIDSGILNNENISRLIEIHKSFRPFKSKHLKKDLIFKEKNAAEYFIKDGFQPELSRQYLGIASYWNIIQYYFPYKNLSDQNWNKTLLEALGLIGTESCMDCYRSALFHLNYNINDSHGQVQDPFTNSNRGNKGPHIKLSEIDSKTYIVHFDKSLAGTGIQRADEVIAIGDKSISLLKNELAKIYGGSNPEGISRNVHRVLPLTNSNGNISYILKRNDSLFKVELPVEPNYINYYYSLASSLPYQLLDSNYLYINMPVAGRSDIRRSFREYYDTKAVIIDLRYGSDYTLHMIARRLTNSNQNFARINKPRKNIPGYYKKSFWMERGFQPYPNFLVRKYKGKVIILAGPHTQSFLEWSALCIQKAGDGIIIGDHTAGANGNIAMTVLPGNIKVIFSGYGISYPDGRQTQRTGITPDIQVEMDADSIKKGEDLVLKKAIDYLRSIQLQ